jgi:hypothetical protein
MTLLEMQAIDLRIFQVLMAGMSSPTWPRP